MSNALTFVKAFMSHNLMVTNTYGVQHPFGELTTDARTYERDVQAYAHPEDKSITMMVFSYQLNGVAQKDPLPLTEQNKVLTIGKAVYDYCLNAGREIYQDELKRKLMQDYHDSTQKVKVGDIVNDGTYYCPKWVSWDDLDGNSYQVWFSDESFKSEYDEYEIEIIAPVDNYDVFFSTRNEVEQALAKKPVDVLTREANHRKADSPVTVFRLDIFKWHNPVTLQPELDTNWYVLIWGDAGDNIDAIKEKIQDTILDNSDHDRDDWKKVFPEIFKRNEFVIVPQWNVYANENKVREKASLYSPFMVHGTALEKYVKPFMGYMSDEHLNQHLQIGSLYYRSIVSAICGSPENKDDKFKITDVFPDFIDVPSTSTDFNYQSKNTQDWSLKLQEMLHIAETMTNTTPLPRERIKLPNGNYITGEKLYTRVIRNGKVFLVMKYQDFHYLVAIKQTIEESLK